MRRSLLLFSLFIASSSFAKEAENFFYFTDPITGSTEVLVTSERPKFVKGGRCSRRPGCYLHFVQYTKYTTAWRCETKDEEPCPWMF